MTRCPYCNNKTIEVIDVDDDTIIDYCPNCNEGGEKNVKSHL